MALRIDNLQQFRKNNRNKKIGVTFSCWDLLHAGHNLFLADSKNQCDILCVGLQTDPTLDRPEKNKPIQTLDEREIQIKSCRYVDYYFVYSTEQTLLDTLSDLKPDVRFLGDDYVGKKYTGDHMMIPVVFHPRSVHTYSTTGLRKHIYQMELNKLNKIVLG
jgi:glycerol-3-phosphate cytidylyltransferase